MSVFDVISLLGGLAMFLYGMRLMSGGIKESSSGTLKRILEKVTNNPIKAFLFGVFMTAVIQSSTATIVITSGLVAAGVLKVRQSMGIIIGANIGTTVTGQIIRLLDVDSSGTAWLEVFKPSTLAPAALIVGVVLLIFLKFRSSDTIGGILIGFGILFSGLLNMTSAVSVLNESGVFEKLFTSLGDNPFLGYLAGTGVAFILQSSSATVGILQALSTSGQLTWCEVYPILVGVYLGDCVTTAIVCSIGAKADAKRVGIANVIYNLLKSVLVFAGVIIFHVTGLLKNLWDVTVNSGIIANTNTVFNCCAALVLMPFSVLIVNLACKIIKDDPVRKGRYDEKLDAMSSVFFATPALAFKSCYDVLMAMFLASKTNIEKAVGLLFDYDAKIVKEIEEEENNVDVMADRVSNYLVQLSPHISSDLHVRILDQYYKVVTEFERLSDHAMNISEVATNLHDNNSKFSDDAKYEIGVLISVINRILEYTQQAFEKRDEVAAKHIEPLEEVVDDLVNALKENHLARLRAGRCNVYMDTGFSNLMSDLERISDVCSNVGVATVVRAERDIEIKTHDYISALHQGRDEIFNREYNAAHEKYFGLLENRDPNESAASTPSSEAFSPSQIADSHEPSASASPDEPESFAANLPGDIKAPRDDEDALPEQNK